jgi:hypothetical protein
MSYTISIINGPWKDLRGQNSKGTAKITYIRSPYGEQTVAISTLAVPLMSLAVGPLAFAPSAPQNVRGA